MKNLTQSHAQADERFLVRAFEPGDETSILRLFEEVFGSARSLLHWQWQFAANPNGKPVSFVAVEEKTGRIIGQHGVWPVAINDRGNKVLACQVLDTMVHPAFRRRGILEAMGKACFTFLTQSGYALAYAFPNHNSYPCFIQKLNWREVFCTDAYFRRLSMRHALTRLLRLPWVVKPLDRAYTRGLIAANRWADQWDRITTRTSWLVKQSTQVPEHYHLLWEQIRTQAAFSIWKDRAYLQWRYQNNPTHQFLFFYLVRDEVPAAIAVVLTEGHSTRIIELLVANHDVQCARRLVRRIERHAMDAGSDRIIFNGHDHGFFAQVFRGFTVHKVESNIFCVRQLASANPDPLTFASDGWSIVEGDSDSV